MKNETKKSSSIRPRKISQGKKEVALTGGAGEKAVLFGGGQKKEVATKEDLGPKEIDRFWSKVNKLGPRPDQSIVHYIGLDRCWEWTGGLFNNGYGQFKCLGYPRSAHRISFMLHNGHMPKKGSACHKCDNRKCVNPDHLFDGDGQDNLSDAKAKGRIFRPVGKLHYSYGHPEKVKRGVRVGGHKVNDAKVVEIRAKYADGLYNQYELSDQYGISVSNINHIIHRKTWAHVP